MHIMEGRKGEDAHDLTVYDLNQRRLIDEEITRRTIDFMKRGVADGKPFYAYVPYTLVHFPSLPNPKFEGKTGYGDFPTVSRRWTLMSAISSPLSTRWAFATKPSSSSPVTTAQRRLGRGRDRPVRGAAIVSPTWRVRSGRRSSSVGLGMFRLAASATRSSTKPTRSPGLVEGAGEEGRLVPFGGFVGNHRSDAALPRGVPVGLAGVSPQDYRGRLGKASEGSSASSPSRYAAKRPLLASDQSSPSPQAYA
jgi:hypothetical protein